MMEHIRDFDWLAQEQEEYFVNEPDMDNSTIEKILRNRFRDPLLSSDSEDETPNNIDWDEVFSSKLNIKNKLFVPCLRQVPPYPKLSSLTIHQHNQILKVLAAENPTVLEGLFLGKPSNKDIKAFKEAQETYVKEQQAYREWAKSLWSTDHCIRALRPKPGVESVYDAEFHVKALRLAALPNMYDVAAQIPLDSRRNNCEFVLIKELITVNLSDMPKVNIPERIEKQFTIMTPCCAPEPCQKHVYQIVLPNENTMSMLPVTEVHRTLAAYAGAAGAQYIASENAIKCLVSQDRHWMIPVTVCETIDPDGDPVNVVVLDSEFSINKESAPIRTYKAFRHLLEHALIPPSERDKMMKKRKNSGENDRGKKDVSSQGVPHGRGQFVPDSSDDDDDDSSHLVIDTGEDAAAPPSESQCKRQRTSGGPAYLTRAAVRRISDDCQDIGLYNCTCKGTLYEKPPRRSFKMWRFKNKNNECHDIVIHCPHKARAEKEELILEPIPEYQIDLGASEQSADSVRSVALALAIRKQASVLLARVDGSTGDVAHLDTLSADEFNKMHPDVTPHVTHMLHTALAQLHALLPGHYVLQHEPNHGANAILFAPRPLGSRQKLVLNFDSAQLIEPDEAKMVKTAPIISTQLLPYHKFRRVAPCTFTPYESQLVKESKRPVAKKKAPPQAIKCQAERQDSGTSAKWPKGKKSRRKKRSNIN